LGDWEIGKLVDGGHGDRWPAVHCAGVDGWVGKRVRP
jgi:hypothetical protein